MLGGHIKRAERKILSIKNSLSSTTILQMKEKLRHSQINKSSKNLSLTSLPYKKYQMGSLGWSEVILENNLNPHKEIKNAWKGIA